MFAKVPGVRTLTYTVHGPWTNPSRATNNHPVKLKTRAVEQIVLPPPHIPILSSRIHLKIIILNGQAIRFG